MDVEAIVAKLEERDGIFPREALEAAVANRDAIIPKLLQILERVNEDPHALLDQPDYMAHIFAMYLLAQFREKRAYPLIVELFSLPGEMCFDLTGDVVTEGLSSILASVSCGDDGLIKELVENETVNEYVRNSAVRALVTLMACGEKTREDIADYFRSLFKGRMERKPSLAWGGLVGCSLDLNFREMKEDIDLCYDEGLVDPAYISPEDIEEELSVDEAPSVKSLQVKRRYTLVTDVIKDTEWWGCFQPPRPAQTPNPAFQAPRSVQTTVKKKKIGRNERCPCGSGKKYKKCCGRP
jgi:hypothetical protein